MSFIKVDHRKGICALGSSWQGKAGDGDPNFIRFITVYLSMICFMHRLYIEMP